MARDPRGAVIRIASTATVSTMFPQAKPIANGIPPMAACTVALGEYANTQNILSFKLSSVPIKEKTTPIALNISPPNITITAAAPDIAIYLSLIHI